MKETYVILAGICVASLALYSTHSMYRAQSPRPSEELVKVIPQENLDIAVDQLTQQREQEQQIRAQRQIRRRIYESPERDTSPFYTTAQGIRSDAEQAQDPHAFERFTDPLGY